MGAGLIAVYIHSRESGLKYAITADAEKMVATYFEFVIVSPTPGSFWRLERGATRRALIISAHANFKPGSRRADEHIH